MVGGIRKEERKRGEILNYWWEYKKQGIGKMVRKNFSNKEGNGDLLMGNWGWVVRWDIEEDELEVGKRSGKGVLVGEEKWKG